MFSRNLIKLDIIRNLLCNSIIVIRVWHHKINSYQRQLKCPYIQNLERDYMLGRGALEAGVVVMIDDDNIFIMVETKPQIRKPLSVTSWSVLDIHSVCIIFVHFFELQIYFLYFWEDLYEFLLHKFSTRSIAAHVKLKIKKNKSYHLRYRHFLKAETLNISGTPWYLILSTSKYLSELTCVRKLYSPNYSLTILCWNIF